MLLQLIATYKSAHAHGINSIAGVCVLFQLAEASLTPGELASRLGTSTANMTNLTDRLAFLGFIKRDPGHLDRRKLHISLTPAGEQALLRISEGTMPPEDYAIPTTRNLGLRYTR